MENKGQLDKLFITTRLPNDKFQEQARRVVLPRKIRRSLLRYRRLILHRQKHSIVDGSLSGLVVFKGKPGNGKTMTARAFAEAMAKAHHRLFGKETVFFELRAPALFSEMLGKTSKTIAEAFEMVRFSAERRQAILLVDELDGIGFSRGRLSSGDPSDCVRATNELLTQLDRLRGCPRFLCIGTTNLDSFLDPALVDRADYVVHFHNPDVQAGKRILQQGAREADRMGIRVAEEELHQVAETLCGKGDGSEASGRLLAKLVLLSYMESSNCPTAAEMIEVAHRRLNGQEGTP